MPASKPAQRCGKRWPSYKWALVWALSAAVMAGAMGCDDEAPAVDREQAEAHARYHGEWQAQAVQTFAVEWTMLHPNSERQRAARERRLRLEEVLELDGQEREDIRRRAEEAQQESRRDR